TGVLRSSRVVGVRRSGYRPKPTTNDYTFALALSLTWPSWVSTVYSTVWQPYCLRICSVFFCTKEAKESRLPETASPALFFASVRARNRFSTLLRSEVVSEHCTAKAASFVPAEAAWPTP